MTQNFSSQLVFTIVGYVAVDELKLLFSDDDESGDDEDVLSRNAIKRYSQQIVDSKTKKHKTRKGKRKTKQ